MPALALEHQTCSVVTTRPGPTQPATYFHLPNLERLRRWICAHPTGTHLTTSVRRLAKAVGCGAAAITPALRQLAADGWIDHLTAPSGTLIEVLVSDAESTPSSDQEPDHHLAPTVPQPARPSQEAIRATIAGGGDHGPDRPPGYKELHDDQEQQQHAREPDFDDRSAGLTATEWATIRQLRPDYTAAQLEADLAKLAKRPGVRSPVAVLIAALRRGEPIWSREELRERNAAIAAHYAPPAPPAADPPPPRRSRSSPAPVPAAVEPVLHAPHGALWDHLLLLMPDPSLADWLCEGFSLEVQQEATVLHCRDTDRAAVARDLRGLLLDALRDLGLPDALEICAPEEAGQAAADHAQVVPEVEQPLALEVEHTGDAARGADHAPPAPEEVDHAGGLATGADHAPPAPEVEQPAGQPARTPTPAAPLADYATAPRPGAAPATQRPITQPRPLTARSGPLAPPGPPCRPQRRQRSSRRAS